MEYLGQVQEVTLEGKLIVKGAITPRPGSIVYDQRQRRIGRVKRIFGPVDSPFISVEPSKDEKLLNTLGKNLYIDGVENNGKGKRRGRRDRTVS